ncbi:MAG TPA: hypothetical protein VM307_07190 [Egibacteraceae bacterium]|nr:hypothetical protein [Egibacteraceae bacterium]
MSHAIKRRVTVLATMISVLLLAGVVSAAWLANGSGSGSAKAITSSGTVSTDTATPTAQLYPGKTADLKIKLTNTHLFPVKVTALAGDGAITATPVNGETCEVHGVELVAGALSNLNLTVDASSNGTTPATAEHTVSNAVKMTNASQDGCQGATFTIPVTITGESNAQ